MEIEVFSECVCYVVCFAVSKSAQKSRRKKKGQDKQASDGRSQEQRDAVSVATHLMGGASISEGSADTDKKLKNLRKVCEWW